MKIILDDIYKNKISFFNNDFSVELNNRQYYITALHKRDISTEEVYSKNPDYIKVSLIEADCKERELKQGRIKTPEQMIKDGEYLRGVMLNKNLLFTVFPI